MELELVTKCGRQVLLLLNTSGRGNSKFNNFAKPFTLFPLVPRGAVFRWRPVCGGDPLHCDLCK